MTANDNDCRPEFEAWLATCGKSPLMWNTSDAMLAAWAAATRAALATQPAAGEPVAWMTRPRIGSHKGREFICEPDVSLNLDNWEKPFPVYATLPAAAHGDSFRTWLTAEMPAGTVIGDPSWWAEHILKRIGAAAHWDEAVRKDAERYRWLRDYWIGDDPASINMDSANRRGLNAAIDAAMRAQAGEGGEP